ncbi:MAG: hypothetical protein WBP41_03100 [Saprospiraceae bacterium]
MDLKKAQRLITKLQAFLDNGNAQDISRLEKDLIKSYVIQLYDAVTEVEEVNHEQEKPIEFVEYKMPKREAAPKIDLPPLREYEPQKSETPEIPKPLYTDHVVTPPKEKTIEEEVHHEPYFKTTPPVEKKTIYHQEPEPIKEAIQPVKIHHSTIETNEGLTKLFDITKTDEMSGRFSHVPIASIESAMGLNERIFTLNELFGGNKTLFDDTCAKLNSFNSFAEARAMLINGPAKDFNWSSPEHLKMAEQFIRIVSRRYPKSVS